MDAFSFYFYFFFFVFQSTWSNSMGLKINAPHPISWHIYEMRSSTSVILSWWIDSLSISTLCFKHIYAWIGIYHTRHHDFALFCPSKQCWAEVISSEIHAWLTTVIYEMRFSLNKEANFWCCNTIRLYSIHWWLFSFSFSFVYNALNFKGVNFVNWLEIFGSIIHLALRNIGTSTTKAIVRAFEPKTRLLTTKNKPLQVKPRIHAYTRRLNRKSVMFRKDLIFSRSFPIRLLFSPRYQCSWDRRRLREREKIAKSNCTEKIGFTFYQELVLSNKFTIIFGSIRNASKVEKALLEMDAGELVLACATLIWLIRQGSDYNDNEHHRHQHHHHLCNTIFT